jgi:hypothetical protein
MLAWCFLLLLIPSLYSASIPADQESEVLTANIVWENVGLERRNIHEDIFIEEMMDFINDENGKTSFLLPAAQLSAGVPSFVEYDCTESFLGDHEFFELLNLACANNFHEADDDSVEGSKESLSEKNQDSVIPRDKAKSKQFYTALRNKAYASLLSEFQKVCKESNSIKWRFFDVTGWPQEVIFYCKYGWTNSDCYCLIQAIERGEISFSSGNYREREYLPKLVRKGLNDRLLAISKELFGAKYIAWREIKKLCPWLHLMHYKITELDATDCQSLEQVIKALEEAKHTNTKTDETYEQEIQDETEIREKPVKRAKAEAHSNIVMLRKTIEDALFIEYQKVCKYANGIDWKLVDVIGWPEQVIFYCKENWNKADCRYVMRALESGQISFIPNNSPQIMDPVYRVKRDLQEKLELASQEHFGTKKIPWRRLKILCPWLHLMSSSIMKQNAADCQSLEKVLRVLEEAKHPNRQIIEKAVELKRTIAVVESNANYAKRMKLQSKQIQDELSNQRQQTHSQLLERYKVLHISAHTISWCKVDILGWPEEVIFYYSYNWTKVDCLRLLEAMPNIHFVYSETHDSMLSKYEQMVITSQVSDFSLKYFGTIISKWSRIQMHVPGFHLSQRKSSEWTRRDAEMLRKVFRVFEEAYPDVAMISNIADCIESDGESDEYLK